MRVAGRDRLSSESDILWAIRQLVATLSLPLLLASNWVGWVHVGCHSPLGCCSATQDLPAATSCQSLACCTSTGHSHASPDTDYGDRRSENRQPCSPHEHDPESCMICQNFLTARSAVLWKVQVTCLAETISQPTVLVDTPPIASADFLRGHFYRGPPMC